MTRSLHDVRLRDPFVLTVPGEGLYYLYGSTDENTWHGPGTGFDAYRSRDLESWEGPFRVFEPPPGFWGKENFWAPEVHAVEGRYFLLATFRGESGRGTSILVGENPLGPFRPHSDGPVTPRGWEALDGTLFVDGHGAKWLVFCHEWQQCDDGRICALALTPDLRRSDGAPEILFSASQAPWTRPVKPNRWVADGPFLHRGRDGALFLLWSSFGEFGYALGAARSRSGELSGPWIHDDLPLWENDGGHGMVCQTLESETRLVLHCPNQTPWERALVLPLRERDGRLEVGSRLIGPWLALRRFHRGGSRRRKIAYLLRCARRFVAPG